MGVLPNSQFGDVAVLDISNTGTSNVVLGIDPHKSTVGVASAVTSNSAPLPLFALDASSSNPLSILAHSFPLLQPRNRMNIFPRTMTYS